MRKANAEAEAASEPSAEISNTTGGTQSSIQLFFPKIAKRIPDDAERAAASFDDSEFDITLFRPTLDRPRQEYSVPSSAIEQFNIHGEWADSDLDVSSSESSCEFVEPCDTAGPSRPNC